MFRRSVAHPVIRQFILRTAVVNYLCRCLLQLWNGLHKPGRRTALPSPRQEASEEQDQQDQQEQQKEEEPSLRTRLGETHRLLQREYDQLFIYMMDKSELWDSPEYFKAKTALGSAIRHLRLYSPKKITQEVGANSC